MVLMSTMILPNQWLRALITCSYGLTPKNESINEGFSILILTRSLTRLVWMMVLGLTCWVKLQGIQMVTFRNSETF